MKTVRGYVMPDLAGAGGLVSFTLRDPDSRAVYKVEIWNRRGDQIRGFAEEWPPQPQTMFDLRCEVTGGRLYADGTLVLQGEPGEHVAFSGGHGGHPHTLWLHHEA